MNKQQALVEYVCFGEQRQQALNILINDTESVSISLTKVMLASVLQKFKSGAIDADALEQWAAFVDLREEILCEEVEDYLYALNNAELMGGISSESVAKMLALLQ